MGEVIDFTRRMRERRRREMGFALKKITEIVIKNLPDNQVNKGLVKSFVESLFTDPALPDFVPGRNDFTLVNEHLQKLNELGVKNYESAFFYARMHLEHVIRLPMKEMPSVRQYLFDSNPGINPYLMRQALGAYSIAWQVSTKQNPIVMDEKTFRQTHG
ncbi:hypothetical protein GF391_02870 [Candidatus Uhrbacteria bacterium]|nr:hypothetical protein [Candidatus Uhrbacteria bacterium]